MKTIKDIIDEIIKLGNCGYLLACRECSYNTFCHVNTMFIALDYIMREGTI